MKSRFPTPENIGKYPSTFGSSYADFGHESPTEQQASDTKEDYPTLSKLLLSNNILGKVAKSIGLTEKDIKIIEQKFFPSVGSKVDDIAIVLLTIALIMPIATKNKDWSRIATFAKKIQEQGAVALKNSLPEQSYELALRISQSFEKGEISPEIQAQIAEISSSPKKPKQSVELSSQQLSRVRELKSQAKPISTPQVQATLPPTSDDSQIADVADVTSIPVTSVTSTPGPAEGQLTLADLEITHAELQALIQAGETLPTLVSENEKLKKEVEAAKKSASTSKYVAIGLSLALLAGGGYWYYTTTQQNQ